MNPQTSPGEVIRGVAAGTSRIALDVLGPTVEFLTSPAAAHHDLCVMRGVMPPEVAVPLHGHDATEVFLVLPGTKHVLTLGGPAEWVDVHARDYVHVPPGCAGRSSQRVRRTPGRARHHHRQAGDLVEEAGNPRHRPADCQEQGSWIIFSPCPRSTATGSVRPA
jgi:hypothetical protein